MNDASDLDAVRREPDPVRQALRAMELQERYQQFAVEAARLRRLAIDRAQTELGLKDTQIAERLGISKGRMSQVRKSGPAKQRGWFGVGPVSVGVPYRYQTTDRERPLIAAEDAETAEQLVQLLASLAFATSRYQIEPDQADVPAGDTVFVCGPKSAPAAMSLLERDPALRMGADGGRWWIEEIASGQRHGSPADEAEPHGADVAYVARHRVDARTIVHIAGIHGIGSLGATHYLVNNLPTIFGETGDEPCSFVVRATYDHLQIVDSDLLAGPFIW
nr:hypothetical protein [Kibdelosporangium sp. MJ126-NF4]CEL13556.1 hypothetical protein [Kibdelosporangium sp. MJ126-NF4]CTQ99242.1 hypothetical protein [Kibdelosporangium sp. MJ126-NF4]